MLHSGSSRPPTALKSSELAIYTRRKRCLHPCLSPPSLLEVFRIHRPTFWMCHISRSYRNSVGLPSTDPTLPRRAPYAVLRSNAILSLPHISDMPNAILNHLNPGRISLSINAFYGIVVEIDAESEIPLDAPLICQSHCIKRGTQAYLLKSWKHSLCTNSHVLLI